MTTEELIEKLKECSEYGYITLVEEEVKEIIKKLEELDELRVMLSEVKFRV